MCILGSMEIMLLCSYFIPHCLTAYIMYPGIHVDDVALTPIEVDRNQNVRAGTMNQPGIRFLVLVPSWLLVWFGKIPVLLGEPESFGLITGQTRKFLVSPGYFSFKMCTLFLKTKVGNQNLSNFKEFNVLLI